MTGVTSSQRLRRHRRDAPQVDALLAVAGLRLAAAESLPPGLLGLLPRLLRLDASTSAVNRWLEPVFELLCDQVDASRPGAAAVLAKLGAVRRPGSFGRLVRRMGCAARTKDRAGAGLLRSPGPGLVSRPAREEPKRAWR
jgi:hypothetical protein